MLKSATAATALATLLLAAVPFFGGTSGEVASIVGGQVGAASSSPVISGIDARRTADESSIRLLEMVERAAPEAGVDDADSDSRDSDTEHSAQKPVAVGTSPGSGGTSSGSSDGSTGGSGTSSGGSSNGGSSSGGSSGGSGSSEPPPAPKPPPAPEPPACPAAVGGSTGGAPGTTSSGGVAGTTSSDLATFAARFNQIRVANCLPPVPFANIRYDSCMEQRLFWMAEDPSTDPMSAWGHIGSQRS
ncbi:MAG: hypothetical protein RJQ01_01990, partial [Microcella sp.]|uniref:hypothetical protein n=1 Tax=Microcella sp. TaxID=1913979 RepID=UPI0033158F05